MSFSLVTAINIEDIPAIMKNAANNYRGAETRRYPELWLYAAELLDDAAAKLHQRILEAKTAGVIRPPTKRVTL